MTTKSSTRKRRAARTRQAIIDAARELITERGAHNLSLREIARRIEYSPAGLYEYFANKEEIVQAVIADGFQRFATSMFSVSTDLPVEEYLHELGMVYVRFARSNPQHYMLIFSRPELQNPVTSDNNFVSAATFQTLVDGVKRGIEDGFYPPSIDVMETSFGNWSIVHGIAMLIVTQCKHMDMDWEATTDQLLRNFRTGMVTDAWAKHEAAQKVAHAE